MKDNNNNWHLVLSDSHPKHNKIMLFINTFSLCFSPVMTMTRQWQHNEITIVISQTIQLAKAGNTQTSTLSRLKDRCGSWTFYLWPEVTLQVFGHISGSLHGEEKQWWVSLTTHLAAVCHIHEERATAEKLGERAIQLLGHNGDQGAYPLWYRMSTFKCLNISSVRHLA